MNMDSYCLTSELSLFGRQLACNIRRTTLFGRQLARRDQGGALMRLFAMVGMAGTVAAAGLLTLVLIQA